MKLIINLSPLIISIPLLRDAQNVLLIARICYDIPTYVATHMITHCIANLLRSTVPEIKKLKNELNLMSNKT